MASVIASLLTVALQTTFLAAIAPAVVGYLRWVKARLQNRRGAGVLQPYREIRKALGKGMVVADTTSWVFRWAPSIVAGATLTAATVAPVVCAWQPADALGDLFLLAALLMLGTATLALAGLDPGTAFGGMGSSREMTVAALTEPTLAIAVLALALTTGSTSLGVITSGLIHAPASAFGPGHLLAFAAFLIAMLAEAGRLPVDNPATHLELTMIHEAMILEFSGPSLAVLEWSAALKIALLLTLAANLFFPWGLATSTAPAEVAIGVLAVVAKLRLFRVPELLAVSFTLALLAATSSFFTR
jgi:formate hydrogenlyase subunit 4